MLVDENNLPILTQHSEDGFVDCIFRIDSIKSDKDHHYFNLLASHDGQRVGLAVKLIRKIGPGFDDDMNLVKQHVYHHGVCFRSLGEISDRLLTVIAELYGQETIDIHMVPEETFTAIALQQNDTDLESNAVRIKLFGRDQEEYEEDDYYESFFNVDLPNGFASWNEKDSDYRLPLIRALSAV